jgi:CRP/FNR family cyclic AMP-dependent transcriptional regulator
MVGEQPNTLARIALFRELPVATRQALEKRCSWRNFAAQEQIIDRQSTSQDVYFIVSGRVRVVNYSMSGREISFDDIDSGNFFGELAAIDGAPRSANIVAL